MNSPAPLPPEVPPKIRRKPTPDDYVCRNRWLTWLVCGSSLALFGGLFLFARTSLSGIVTLAVIGTFAGAALTLVGMGWASVIALADDTKRGLLFVLLPPYMPWYAVTRWKWMAQPTLIFLTGALFVGASIWTSLELLAALEQAAKAQPPNAL